MILHIDSGRGAVPTPPPSRIRDRRLTIRRRHGADKKKDPTKKRTRRHPVADPSLAPSAFAVGMGRNVFLFEKKNGARPKLKLELGVLDGALFQAPFFLFFYLGPHLPPRLGPHLPPDLVHICPLTTSGTITTQGP